MEGDLHADGLHEELETLLRDFLEVAVGSLKREPPALPSFAIVLVVTIYCDNILRFQPLLELYAEGSKNVHSTTFGVRCANHGVLDYLLVSAFRVRHFLAFVVSYVRHVDQEFNTFGWFREYRTTIFRGSLSPVRQYGSQSCLVL